MHPCSTSGLFPLLCGLLTPLSLSNGCLLAGRCSGLHAVAPPLLLCRFHVSCSFHSLLLHLHHLHLSLSLSWFCIAVVLYVLFPPPPVPPTPSARRALSHGSVLRLFTVLWLVRGSQSCWCEAVSAGSVLWLVFRVDHVHKAPQLPGLTHPHIQSV